MANGAFSCLDLSATGDTETQRESTKGSLAITIPACYRLLLRCLGNLAALDAAGAGLDALSVATTASSLHRLKIRVPATTRNVVRVRNVVTELRAFAAKLTYLCHNVSPNKL